MTMDRIILEFAQDTYQDTSIKILLLQLFITKLPLYTLTAAGIHFSPFLYIAIHLLIIINTQVSATTGGSGEAGAMPATRVSNDFYFGILFISV